MPCRRSVDTWAPPSDRFITSLVILRDDVRHAPQSRSSRRFTPPLNDEGRLVEQARAGDAQAFTELVNRYERKVYRLAKHITQNDEDAEDVLQEAFLKAYEHLDTFKGDSKFYTWIVRIAVNEALMKLRKRRSDRTVPLDEPIDTGEETVAREIAVWEDNPEQRYSREEMHDILDQAVESLKPDFRTVFVLRDIEELSTEEIGYRKRSRAPRFRR